MTDTPISLTLNRGSDILWDVLFKDDTGAPLPMTGWTIAIFEADAWGAANGTVAWTDQATGQAKLSAPWVADTPDRTWFRLRVTRTADGFYDALPQITVRYS